MPRKITKGIVNRGHQVASGTAEDERFPEGTLALQIPRFAERGIDLDAYYRGTLNVSIAPNAFRVSHAWRTLPQVKWSPVMPAENFSFYRCEIRISGVGSFEKGLVYWPHPSTKPEFEQDPSILEILAPFIEEANYGSEMDLLFDPDEIEITR
tara:strand:- start:647 stop:1105 length:459 start_codon:yes stop_codon:yes gene_type:complete